MNKTILFILISIALINTSCDTSTSSILDGITSNESQTEELQSQKLNLIVENFNNTSHDVMTIYSSYINDFGDDPEAFIPYDNPNISHLSDFYLNHLDDAVSVDAYPMLNPLIEEYKLHGLKLCELTKELNTYYSLKDYVDDNYQKGKKNHAQMIQTLFDFLSVNSILRSKSDSLSEIGQMKFLNKMKDEGNTLEYLTGISMMKAGNLIDFVNVDDIFKLDLTDLKKQQAEIRDKYDQLEKYQEEHEAELTPSQDRYIDLLKDYLKYTKSLIIRIEAQTPYSRHELNYLNTTTGWTVEGSYDQIARTFNDLVGSYNQTIQ